MITTSPVRRRWQHFAQYALLSGLVGAVSVSVSAQTSKSHRLAPLSQLAGTKTDPHPFPVSNNPKLINAPTLPALPKNLFAAPHQSTLAADPIPGCAAIELGSVYSDSTPPANGFKCYQFVLGARTKVDAQIALPTGVNGFAALYAVDPATGQLEPIARDTDQSPNFPLLVQAVSQDVRLVLALQPSNGAGGQSFRLGAWSRAGFDGFEPNDKPNTATVVAMNQSIASNLDSQGIDQDYFFFPLNANQTSALVQVNWGFNQAAGVRLAQKNGSTYASGPETALATNGASYFFQSLPANTPGSATPYGLLVRVYNRAAPSQGSQNYTVRVGVATGYISGLNQFNNEAITRAFPISGQLQAANYISLSTKVTDASGAPVEGETVVFRVQYNTGDANAFQNVTAKTNSVGSANATITFPACSGATATATYRGTGTFAGLWRGTAQSGGWQVALPNAHPLPPNANGNLSQAIPFVRICKETLIGL